VAGPPGARFSWRKLIVALVPLMLIGAAIGFDIPICPTRNLLGIPCPGCGLTRATEAAAHGDVMGMLRFHPLAPIFTPLFVFAILRSTLVSGGIIRNDRWDWMSRVPSWAWAVLGIALMGLWGARMFGLLGGLPDPIDFTQGWLYRGGHFLLAPIFGWD
jgi:hypothetical protein